MPGSASVAVSSGLGLSSSSSGFSPELASLGSSSCCVSARSSSVSAGGGAGTGGLGFSALHLAFALDFPAAGGFLLLLGCGSTTSSRSCKTSRASSKDKPVCSASSSADGSFPSADRASTTSTRRSLSSLAMTQHCKTRWESESQEILAKCKSVAHAQNSVPNYTISMQKSCKKKIPGFTDDWRGFTDEFPGFSRPMRSSFHANFFGSQQHWCSLPRLASGLKRFQRICEQGFPSFRRIETFTISDVHYGLHHIGLQCLEFITILTLISRCVLNWVSSIIPGIGFAPVNFLEPNQES